MKKLLPLTPKQKAIVDFLNSHYKSKGYAPSLGEIAEKFNLRAVSTVHQHIQLIQKKGYLQKDDFQPRGISPLKKEEEYMEVPLMGTITAGTPIEPLENPEPVLVPRAMIRQPANYYALNVKGESMINEGIWDGDTILIKHQKDANLGDVIVAVVDGEVTLKEFGGYENGKVKLIPKNPFMKPFEVDSKNFEVRGKFAGLIRREKR